MRKHHKPHTGAQNSSPICGRKWCPLRDLFSQAGCQFGGLQKEPRVNQRTESQHIRTSCDGGWAQLGKEANLEV